MNRLCLNPSQAVCSVAQSCPTLRPHGLSPGSSVHGIFQARILEWVVIFYSPSQPREQTSISCVSCTGRQILHHCAITFDSLGPMDYSPPASSVNGILQVRILEWVAIPFSRDSSQPKDQTQLSCIAGGFFTV